jgi:hypothetical protein
VFGNARARTHTHTHTHTHIMTSRSYHWSKLYIALSLTLPFCVLRSMSVKMSVKLSLCFNWAPGHEGVLGSRGIAPRILDLGTRWRGVVSFTPDRFTPRERAPGTHLIGSWVGPRSRLDAIVKRKIPSPCQGIELPIIQPVAQRYTVANVRKLCIYSGTIFYPILSKCRK